MGKVSIGMESLYIIITKTNQNFLTCETDTQKTYHSNNNKNDVLIIYSCYIIAGMVKFIHDLQIIQKKSKGHSEHWPSFKLRKSIKILRNH